MTKLTLKIVTEEDFFTRGRRLARAADRGELLTDASAPTTTLIFFDTEFTGLGLDPRLISIGLISADGQQSFYAEVSDSYQSSDVGDFARHAVLPLLEGGEALMPMHELALRLGNWLESFGRPVQLATDSVAWDWPWIQKLFCAPWTWPANLDAKPLLLSMNYLVDYDQFDAAVARAFASGLRRHHSLDDAKANRLGWLAAGGV